MRRHDATMQFQKEVLGTLSSILDRLQGLEQKTNAVPSWPMPPPGLKDDQSMQDIIDLESRVGSMERLLFQVHLEDFSKIENIIETAVTVFEFDSNLSNMGKVESRHRQALRCLTFSILWQAK